MIDEKIPKDLLAHNAAIIEEQDVKRVFTEDELKDLKDKFFKISTHKTRREDYVKLVKDLINESMAIDDILERITKVKNLGEIGLKQLKKDFKEMLILINNGYEIRNETVYGFSYTEENRMAFYDSEGIFLYDRPLREEERQGTVFNMKSKSA